MMKTTHLAVAFLLVVAACATLGDDAAFPDPVESGVGPFRLLADAELGIEEPSPAGRILPEGPAVGRGMLTSTMLWYAAAEALDAPPERNPELADFEVDWDRFAPRAIFASPSAAPTRYSFDSGTVALEATEDGQGDSVFDPWAVEASDGSVRLYFACEGGIGVATRSAGGTFGTPTQLLEDAAAPSVVEFDGETLLFFERAGRIGLARSSDGLTFRVTAEALDLGEREREAEMAMEVGQRSPGAVVVTSVTGRVSLRLYFEARVEEDGDLSSDINVAASADLETFERFSGELFGDNGVLSNNPGQPAPFVEVDGVTHLTLTRAIRGMEQFRGILGAITPARLELVPSPEEP